MSKRSTKRKKRLILAFFIIILALAVFYKGGLFIYNYYFKDIDTLAQFIPQNAHWYFHLNIDKTRDPFKTFEQKIIDKNLVKEMSAKFTKEIQANLDPFDLDWQEDVVKEIKNEVSFAKVLIEEEEFPILILETNDAFSFEQKVLTKIRQEKPLDQIEYSEIKIKNFQTTPRLAEGSAVAHSPIYNLERIYYSVIGNNLIISSSQIPIEQVIDTYKEKSPSIKSEVSTKYSNQVFYSYVNLEKIKSDNFSNQWLKSFQNVLSEQEIEQLFIWLEVEDEQIKLKAENKKGIFGGWNLSQTIYPEELFNFIPADFKIAVLERKFDQFLGNSLDDLLKNNITSFDSNSLIYLSKILPSTKLIDQIENDLALLAIDNNNNYILVVQKSAEAIDQTFSLLEQELKEMSARFNPTEQEINFDDADKAIELIPQPDEVVITNKKSLGERFYSVPLITDEIIYGRQDNFIILSDDHQLIQSALLTDKKKYYSSVQSCLSNWPQEIFIWPITDLAVPLLEEVVSQNNFVVAGNDLQSSHFTFNSCFFLE